ncbi:uncharacterized protein G2W53_020280 [Senna tora]|uniref:Uncharacterized protein n=1 Tax=Senna tora TaxID=362788 RepID=A0A834WRC3_9FABA|nr:uncharacterized protein G2W53_020280 [Senna tora]
MAPEFERAKRSDSPLRPGIPFEIKPNHIPLPGVIHFLHLARRQRAAPSAPLCLSLRSSASSLCPRMWRGPSRSHSGPPPGSSFGSPEARLGRSLAAPAGPNSRSLWVSAGGSPGTPRTPRSPRLSPQWLRWCRPRQPPKLVGACGYVGPCRAVS